MQIARVVWYRIKYWFGIAAAIATFTAIALGAAEDIRLLRRMGGEYGGIMLAAQNDVEAPVLVNINTASEHFLQRLPGIGPAAANAIAEYREANGGFKSTEELVKVGGIGEKTLEMIRSRITI